MRRQMLLNAHAIALGNLKMQKLLTYFFLLMFLLQTEAYAQSEIESIKKSISANTIFIRHALAPGFGDPPDFTKEDCSTQRNLNNKGRLQAQLIGDYLKKSNLLFSEILTSEWCRCIDTAKELDIGQWETFSGLNSFFEGHEKKDTVMARLRKKLASLKPSDLVLFVTHQVVITELTDEVPRSGEMVLYNSITKQKSRFMVDF